MNKTIGQIRRIASRASNPLSPIPCLWHLLLAQKIAISTGAGMGHGLIRAQADSGHKAAPKLYKNSNNEYSPRRSIPLERAHSSVGRALQWHCRGQRFDPAWVHFFALFGQHRFSRCFVLSLCCSYTLGVLNRVLRSRPSGVAYLRRQTRFYCSF